MAKRLPFRASAAKARYLGASKGLIAYDQVISEKDIMPYIIHSCIMHETSLFFLSHTETAGVHKNEPHIYLQIVLHLLSHFIQVCSGAIFFAWV